MPAPAPIAFRPWSSWNTSDVSDYSMEDPTKPNLYADARRIVTRDCVADMNKKRPRATVEVVRGRSSFGLPVFRTCSLAVSEYAGR
jgi:hypothetical protein